MHTFLQQKRLHLFCALINTNVCIVISFSARNGGINVVAAEIDNMIKENGRDALHLPQYHLDLNPIKLVCGDIKTE
jgi:hypothetical protein